MTKQVFIAGAAGLVGQNLIAALAGSEDLRIVGIDKHGANLATLRRLHPNLQLIEADLAEPGAWEKEAAASDCIVMLQAQIGGLDPKAFERNNIISPRRILDAAGGRSPYLVHVSSSV